MDFHIRHRLARRGGNSFYRDRSERTSTTFCGAPCTEWDAAWAERKRVKEWTSERGGLMTPCQACQERIDR